MNKFVPYILIGIAVIAGFFLKDYMGLSKDNSTQKNVNNEKIINQFESLLIYPKKNLIRDFSLKDQNGNSFNNNSFKGKWNIIFSGYTNCPDVCPNTLNQMTQLYQLMDKDIRNDFQFIFLSVDPKRDTSDHLKQYLDYFHKDFVGITGEFSQIDVLIKDLGGIYSINQEEGDYYTVDHSARIFIVDPTASRYGIFESSALKASDKSQLAKDLVSMSSR